MTDAAVVALAQALRAKLREDQRAGEIALSAFQFAADDAAASWPQLDQIARCYSSPGDGCLCDAAGFIHSGQPEPIPAWVDEAREVKLAAQITQEAVQLAMADPDDGLVLVAAPFDESRRQSLGEWLAGLYRTDREGFYRTFQVLRDDPNNQEAVAEAGRIVFGDQPPPPAGEVRPAIPLLSHPSVRNAIPLEGHRNRVFRSAEDGPPPPPPAPERRKRRHR